MRAPRLTELLVVLCLLALAAILFPVFAQSRGGHKPSCWPNLRRLSAAMLLDEADGRLPDRDRWMDAVDSRIFWLGALRCPQVPKGGYGYAFNGLLSCVKQEDLNEPATVPMLYDSVNPIRNASDLYTSLPSPGRHTGSDLVAYADGHVKSVRVP